MCGQVYAAAHVWRSEVTGLWELFVFLWEYSDYWVWLQAPHPLSHLASPKERFLLHRSKSHDLEKLNNLLEVTQLTEASGFKRIVVVAERISPDPACEFWVQASLLVC